MRRVLPEQPSERRPLRQEARFFPLDLPSDDREHVARDQGEKTSPAFEAGHDLLLEEPPYRREQLERRRSILHVTPP